jgi:DNA topoisomerase-1
VQACRAYIGENFPPAYLPAEAAVYSASDNAQEAHEAIRPSNVQVLQSQLANMERDAERLYELIWRQFVACQMPAAEYTSTTITVAAADFELAARGRIVRFDGYTRVLPPQGRKGEDTVLPDLAPGDALKLLELHPQQHFTTPPPRYGEAKLVSELEKRGIGRPSTYASIISTIQDRGYVRLENRRFYAEKMGEIVTDRLQGASAICSTTASPRVWRSTSMRSRRASWTGRLSSTRSMRISGSASRRPGFPSRRACRRMRRR